MGIGLLKINELAFGAWKYAFFIFLFSNFFLFSAFSSSLELVPHSQQVVMLQNENSKVCQFKLLNTGDSSLTIQDVHFSCDCLHGKKESFVILPGESYSYEVEVRGEGKSGKGDFFILFYSNDLEKRLVRARLQVDFGEIQGHSFEVYPKNVRFSFISGRLQAKARIIVRNRGSLGGTLLFKTASSSVSTKEPEFYLDPGEKMVLPLFWTFSELEREGTLSLSLKEGDWENVIPYKVKVHK